MPQRTRALRIAGCSRVTQPRPSFPTTYCKSLPPTILFQGEALDVFAELFFGVEHADEHADGGGDAAVDDRVVEKHMCGLRNVVDCLDCHEVRPESALDFSSRYAYLMASSSLRG